MYAEETVDSILDFIIGFIKIVLGDEQSFSEEFQSQSKSSVSAVGNPLGLTHGEPLLVVLDTVHLMDEPSWRLLELIKDECYHIGILLLVQTDTNNTIKIHPEARAFYDETFGSNQQITMVDLPQLKKEDLSLLISDIASKYQATMAEEIHLMTHIDDPEHSIKNP